MTGYAEIKGCPLFRQIWAFIATTTTSITCVPAKCLQIIDIYFLISRMFIINLTQIHNFFENDSIIVCQGQEHEMSCYWILWYMNNYCIHGGQ